MCVLLITTLIMWPNNVFNFLTFLLNKFTLVKIVYVS